ncbi:MAG: flavodoxin family protein [Gammaproteobacteria bacterium]|jgi:multimeric flavodoxin WrbA
MTRHLMVVHHSQSGSTSRLAQALVSGARDPAVSGVVCSLWDALKAGAGDVRRADAVILATPENFGYMAGAMKHFFDTIYYPCIEHTQGLPYALVVKAGNDGLGAVQAMQRIIAGLRWREVAEPIIVRGELGNDALERCRELGLTFSAGLESGVF